MNIFATSADPIACAQFLDDRRVNKMCLETAQILSTVVGGPYKPTHVNHPCVRWVKEDLTHFNWLAKHGLALCHEYAVRFGQTHACQEVIKDMWTMAGYMSSDSPKYFADCTEAKLAMTNLDVHTKYRVTLINKWANDFQSPTWYGSRISPFLNGGGGGDDSDDSNYLYLCLDHPDICDHDIPDTGISKSWCKNCDQEFIMIMGEWVPS